MDARYRRFVFWSAFLIGRSFAAAFYGRVVELGCAPRLLIGGEPRARRRRRRQMLCRLLRIGVHAHFANVVGLAGGRAGGRCARTARATQSDAPRRRLERRRVELRERRLEPILPILRRILGLILFARRGSTRRFGDHLGASVVLEAAVDGGPPREL